MGNRNRVLDVSLVVLGALFGVFCCAAASKVWGAVSWSWWSVCAPLWVPALLVGAVLVGAVVLDRVTFGKWFPAVIPLVLLLAAAGCGDNLHDCGAPDAEVLVDAKVRVDADPARAFDLCKTVRFQQLHALQRCGLSPEESVTRLKSLPGTRWECETATTIRDEAAAEACLVELAAFAGGPDCDGSTWTPPASCLDQFGGGQ